MGSACHQYGVYQVLPALQSLLEANGVGDLVDVRGAFCLGPCMNGIVIAVGERQFLNIHPQNLEQRFAHEILPFIQQCEGDSHDG